MTEPLCKYFNECGGCSLQHIDYKIQVENKRKNLIEANRYFLKYMTRKIPVINSVIIDPVYIEDGVVIKNSVIGPYVSIAKNAVISDSVIQESIINKRARIESSHLTSSIIGEDALVKGDIKKVNVGDHSEIFL